jgi:O-antigen/teichoic acid export membrane protein
MYPFNCLNGESGGVIAQKSFLLYAANQAGVLVRLVTVAIVANILGAASIGVIAFAYAFIGFFLFLYKFGLDTAHMRKIADGADVGECVGAYVLLKTMITLGTTALIVAVMLAGGAFGYKFGSAAEQTVVVLILISVAIGHLFDFPLATFTARREIARKVTIGTLRSVLDLPIVLIVLLAAGMRNVQGLALGHLINEIVAVSIGIVLYRRAARAGGYRMRMPRWKLVREYVMFALPMLGSLGLGCLAVNVDLVMVKEFMGNAASGNYYVVSRISAAVLGIAAALMTVVLPTASTLYARGKSADIARILRQAERFLSMIIAFLAMGMFVFAEEIMLIFGEDFAGLAPMIMRVFAVITFLFAVNRPFDSAAIISNRPWIHFHLTVVLTAANIALNLILIPKSLFGVRMLGLGAVGSALGTACLAVVGFLMARLVAKWLLGVRTCRGVLMHLFAAAVVGGACWAAKPCLLQGGRWEVLLKTSALGVAAAGVYLGLLRLLGEFSAKDVRKILAMMNPARMKEQFVEEIFTRTAAGRNKNEKEALLTV